MNNIEKLWLAKFASQSGGTPGDVQPPSAEGHPVNYAGGKPVLADPNGGYPKISPTPAGENNSPAGLGAPFPGIIPPAALAGMRAGGNALAGVADKAKNPVNVMQSMAQGMPNVPGAVV